MSIPQNATTRQAARFDRRELLFGLGATLGTVAFHSLLRAEETGPLAPKPGHVASRAKSCIFLFLEGGPSHIDTFDPKPKLDELHMQEFHRKDKLASAMASGKRYFVKSPFEFERAGESGLPMNRLFSSLRSVADDLCYYRGCVGESINHARAYYHMNTGNRFGGDPAIGSWVTYGLGSPNQDLPGFIVLPEVYFPQGGAANWSNGFLPAFYQGTPLRPKGSPILNLRPPPGISSEVQRANLDFLAKLERDHARRHPEHDKLAARLHSYELAFRMQSAVPGLVDLSRESAKTRESYGLDNEACADIGRRCLLARRLVEQGVRFVEIYASGWDSHDNIAKAHDRRIRAIDQPLAALISDLKTRGMLDETLVIACGEFGRTPDNGMRGGKKVGRDHNAEAMTVLFAGGGVRGGEIVGATDEIGEKVVEVAHPIRDLHVTILRLLGLDDRRLTYFHGGRFKQLSQTGGEVIDELIA